MMRTKQGIGDLAGPNGQSTKSSNGEMNGGTREGVGMCRPTVREGFLVGRCFGRVGRRSGPTDGCFVPTDGCASRSAIDRPAPLTGLAGDGRAGGRKSLSFGRLRRRLAGEGARGGAAGSGRLGFGHVRWLQSEEGICGECGKRIPGIGRLSRLWLGKGLAAVRQGSFLVSVGSVDVWLRKACRAESRSMRLSVAAICDGLCLRM